MGSSEEKNVLTLYSASCGKNTAYTTVSGFHCMSSSYRHPANISPILITSKNNNFCFMLVCFCYILLFSLNRNLELRSSLLTFGNVSKLSFLSLHRNLFPILNVQALGQFPVVRCLLSVANSSSREVIDGVVL